MEKNKKYKYRLQGQNNLLEEAGTYIAQYRKGAGLTQEKLGSLIGMDKSQISKIESGKNLTASTICKVFGSMGACVSLNAMPAANIPAESYIEDLVVVISEFAKRKNISEKQAFNYLDRFGGLIFFLSDPELEKTFPMSETLEAMETICKRNGGCL